MRSTLNINAEPRLDAIAMSWFDIAGSRSVVTHGSSAHHAAARMYGESNQVCWQSVCSRGRGQQMHPF